MRAMKRLSILLALAVLLPAGARADTTIRPPFALGPQGGDMWNRVIIDEKTGEMTVLRAQPAGISGGLGCGGIGGFANFEVEPVIADDAPIGVVTVTWADAVVDPYTFVNVGVRKDGNFLESRIVRGPLTGMGGATVSLDEPTSGTLEIWFGIQVASACPNIDGGRARFTSVILR